MPNLVDETKKIWEHVTELENGSRAKRSTSRATRQERKMVDLETDMLRKRVKLDGLSARMTEVETRVSELEKHSEQAERKACVTMSRHSLLYYEQTTFKEWMSKGILCFDGMAKRVVNANKNVAALVDSLQKNALNLQGTLQAKSSSSPIHKNCLYM